MNRCPQNSTGNAAAAATTNSNENDYKNVMRAIHTLLETVKQGGKDNDTHKKKRALPQGVKEAKRMKQFKEELGITGEELKQLNAAFSNIQSEIIEIRMGQRLLLQKMARQEELIVDILDAIEEGDSVKVDDLVQILFST